MGSAYNEWSNAEMVRLGLELTSLNKQLENCKRVAAQQHMDLMRQIEVNIDLLQKNANNRSAGDKDLLRGLVGKHDTLYQQSAEFHAVVSTLLETLPPMIDAYAALAQTQLNHKESELEKTKIE